MTSFKNILFKSLFQENFQLFFLFLQLDLNENFLVLVGAVFMAVFVEYPFGNLKKLIFDKVRIKKDVKNQNNNFKDIEMK